ncbi:MAG: transcriptional regulator, partial [Flavobacterium sp.]|nr:transcriptional regulator [Flavobacterium sp.]
EQALNKSCTSSETGTEQAVVPSINYINNTNILNDKNVSNLEKHTKNFEEINNSVLKNETEDEKEKKLREKKKDEFVTSSEVEKPTIEIVKTYFQENNFPEQEAQKFYNYFKSVGWLVGGKTPMVDWQAAAQNWMINAPKFISNAEQPNRAKQLNTTTDKDYSEPL